MVNIKIVVILSVALIVLGATASVSIALTPGNTYWNENSQRVANYLVENGWNSYVQLLHDDEPGCRDYVGGNFCDSTYWTTSDNIPTCWTLGDFGFITQMNECKAKVISLGAFSLPNDGMRYEVYVGSPIVEGNPGDHHTILLQNGSTIICANLPCSNHPFGVYPGTNQTYNIQADAYSGHGASPVVNPNDSVDTVAPQAVLAWLNGDLPLYTSLTENLIQRYTSSDYVGVGSTWQLGQVMFVMRIGGYDSTPAFSQMQKMLWSLQSPQGWLPNQYTAAPCNYDSSGHSATCTGHDPENQDAGLLPYSASVVDAIRQGFDGGSATTTITSTVTSTVTATSTITKTSVSTTTVTSSTTTTVMVTPCLPNSLHMCPVD